MSLFKQISPLQGAMLRELQERQSIAFTQLSPNLRDNYENSIKDSGANETRMSEYVFWYLYNLCCQVRFVEISVQVNGKRNFHFGLDVLSSLANKHGAAKTEGLENLAILSEEIQGLEEHLQVDAVVPRETKKLITPIWEEELMPFLKCYFLFSIPQNTILNRLSLAEQELRLQVGNIINQGEPVKILHIKFFFKRDVLARMGLRSTREMLRGIHSKIHSRLPTPGFLLVLSYPNYILVAAESCWNKGRAELYKELQTIKHTDCIDHVVYQKNMYEGSIDMATLHRELHV